MINVSPNVKFPFNLIKGSVASRREFVSKTNEEMINSLLPMMQKGCHINKFKKAYNKVIPENKKIEIRSLDYSLNDKSDECIDGMQGYKYSGKDIIGITLELRIGKCKNLADLRKMKISDKHIMPFIHENTHVLDTLTNPKYTAIEQKLLNNNKYCAEINNWYDKYLYVDEFCGDIPNPKKVINKIKVATDKVLSGKLNSDKIMFLKCAEYRLEMEKYAYAEQLRCAEKLKSKGIDIYNPDSMDMDKCYLFTEKINFLKSKIFEIISQERKILSSSHN